MDKKKIQTLTLESKSTTATAAILEAAKEELSRRFKNQVMTVFDAMKLTGFDLELAVKDGVIQSLPNYFSEYTSQNVRHNFVNMATVVQFILSKADTTPKKAAERLAKERGFGENPKTISRYMTDFYMERFTVRFQEGAKSFIEILSSNVDSGVYKVSVGKYVVRYEILAPLFNKRFPGRIAARNEADVLPSTPAPPEVTKVSNSLLSEIDSLISKVRLNIQHMEALKSRLLNLSRE